MSAPVRIALTMDGSPAPAPSMMSRLPRRLALPVADLEALAARAGTPLPWHGDAAALPCRLARALGDDRPAGPAAAPDAGVLDTLGLLTPAGAPVAELAAALAVFATPEVAVRLDLGVRRPEAPRGVARFTGWHHHRAGRVTALSTCGGPEVELAWFADDHWPRELEHLVTVPADHGPAPDTDLTLPFELLLGSAAAVRQQRPPVLAELLARHPMSGPDRTPLRATAAAEQVRLLHTVERGRLRVTVVGRGEGARTLGLVTWVLYADGWRALVPATADGVAVVHVVSTDPGALGATVARLVAGARPCATRP